MDFLPFLQSDSPMGTLELIAYLNDLLWRELGSLKSRLWSPPWTESRIVEIQQGFIQGRRYKLGREFVDAFLGIPFGKPPVGELRFQKPLPAEPWKENRNCTEFGPRCLQDEMIFEKYPALAEMSEDCLRLNVFAPSWTPAACGQPNGFAVIVFIHGGGFAIHSSANFGCHGICESLCTKDVIVVTIQYRLGFFGFSCGEEIPSNLGLWDQTLAFKWVQENISAFGGDPMNITAFGQSAGAASVDCLCLSPHSRNLFQKVITMGGSTLCSFSINDKKHVSTVCLDFAKSLGYKPTPNRNHFDFLRTLPATALAVGIIGEKINRNGKIDLTPVFDGDFFPRPLEELRKETPSKVILSGITEHEGLLFVGLRPAKKNPLHVEVEKLLERELMHQKVRNIDDVKKKLLNMYWKGISKLDKKESAKVCVKIVSDVYMNNGAWLHTDIMTKLGHTVYQYCFEYYNPNGLGLVGTMLPFKGATHGTDIPYVFKKGMVSNFHPNDDDLKMVEIMTRYYTNFAKFGNPNGAPWDLQIWKPLFAENTLKYMAINLEKCRMCENLNDGRSEYWKQLLDADSEKGIFAFVRESNNNL
uniref:Carboxylesterase type B domain-containing protein n=1 Tax=Panagrolaimus sp. ES5 TaxID=591445 RepID=A0AC34F2S5_9BILA